jgi:hypothetical protein
VSAPSGFYRIDYRYKLVIFELRFTSRSYLLHHGSAVWQEAADMEMLAFNHSALIARLDGLWELAPW